MAYQKTFAMLKPGALQRRIVGELVSRMERKGLKIVGMKLMNVPEDLCRDTTPSTRANRFTTT